MRASGASDHVAVDTTGKQGNHHRATYWLELGIWRGRCTLCGWQVKHASRRQAVSMFRYHAMQARAGASSAGGAAPGASRVIDLTLPDGGPERAPHSN